MDPNWLAWKAVQYLTIHWLLFNFYMNIQIIWILSSTTCKDGIMYKLKGKELEERNKKKKNKKKKIELQRSRDVWLCTNEFKFLIWCFCKVFVPPPSFGPVWNFIHHCLKRTFSIFLNNFPGQSNTSIYEYTILNAGSYVVCLKFWLLGFISIYGFIEHQKSSHTTTCSHITCCSW